MTAIQVKEDKVTEVAAKAVTHKVTYKDLMGKPRRALNFTVTSADEDGNATELPIKYQAISSKAYDDLQASHPPSSKDKAQGASYNVDTFAPALIAAVSCIPRLTLAEATEIHQSEDWSGGEIGNLFMNALLVCNSGFDIPFNARD